MVFRVSSKNSRRWPEVLKQMNQLNWNIPLQRPVIPDALLNAGFSPLLAALLSLRGIYTAEKAHAFLHGNTDSLKDPLLLTDMPLAVGRITRAVRKKEHVAVYGDYDVDGITSACLLTDYLRSIGLHCEIYIPDRMEEGYGLNVNAIQTLHTRGVTLIISVDCGVTAIQEAEFASKLGIDMIITDHHECREILPDAVAVIDPKRPDCNYPSQSLAGVGVAFKLVCAIDGNSQRILDRYSDLLAVGTIADVMPVTEENRYIIQAGLQKLIDNPRPGLAALIQEAGIYDKKLNTTAIGYNIAPRLNAAGRLGEVSVAVDLLLSSDSKTSKRLAAQLCEMNRSRQVLETAIWEQANAMLQPNPPTTPIVLACENWHQGVIGIAASRLTESFSLPAVMISLQGEKGKGSCRSFGGFNLFEALSACSEHLESFGGHALAAGLNIRRDHIDAFRQALGEYYISHPPTDETCLEIALTIDDPALLTMDSVISLDQLEPFGNENPRPCMCILAAVVEAIIPVGGGKHVRLRIDKFGQSYECIYFSHSVEDLGFGVGDLVDLAFFPQINEFRGHRSVQLLINNIRPADLPLTCQRISMLSSCSAAEAAELQPDHADFARLWRGILSLGGTLSGTITEIINLCSVWIRYPPKLYICLSTFEELNLLEITKNGAQLTITLCPTEKKVDLTSSKLMQMLSHQ